MLLQLKRPIVFLDLETTGLDISTDRIVELAFVKFAPDGEQTSLVQRINPGIVMSKQATKITGIHTDDAAGLFWGPPFKKVGARLAKFLDGCDLAGFNQIAYDVPLWQAECRRHSIDFDLRGRLQVDVRLIFNAKEPGWDRFLMGPRNLSAAVRHYCGRELEGAHGAEADCKATADVLFAQLERYPDLPRDVAGLHKFCAGSHPAEQDARQTGASGSFA